MAIAWLTNQNLHLGNIFEYCTAALPFFSHRIYLTLADSGFALQAHPM